MRAYKAIIHIRTGANTNAEQEVVNPLRDVSGNISKSPYGRPYKVFVLAWIKEAYVPYRVLMLLGEQTTYSNIVGIIQVSTLFRF